MLKKRGQSLSREEKVLQQKGDIHLWCSFPHTLCPNRCTFTPKINKSKKKIASANSRLYNPTKDIQELEERKIAMELEGCTFQVGVIMFISGH